ncbi:cadherin-like and PC-esterase domain-containing protein 1 isoform X2 [Esox lucius]|uniref:cadherin-like and PC-esterase domain-containing protein 1 isoform X2 n=1 Tax=Esox lucius TaxID=8010 RepID=UPI00147688C8|nr:cadherin-like and PC-esterase domain-containing protein 1 isoform X2 [Esox lucius]
MGFGKAVYKSSLMVCISFSASKVGNQTEMLLRRLWTLRRRYCSGPLLLLGVAVCLFYQTLMTARSRFKGNPLAVDESNKSIMTASAAEVSDEVLLNDPVKLISVLEDLERKRDIKGCTQNRSRRVMRAVVLTGQHSATDTEVQLYRWVLEQRGYEVSLSRYAETSAALKYKNGGSNWNVLVCLTGSEKSCLRRVFFSHLHPHQKVNIIPGLVEAFSDVGGLCHFQTDSRLAGLALPISPTACGLDRTEHGVVPIEAQGDWGSAVPTLNSSRSPGLVAMVNVYVLVTSVTPLTVFLHHSGLVRTNESTNSHTTQLKSFFLLHLGPGASNKALGHVKEVIGQVLRAAALTNEEPNSKHRCLLCFQLMTFTLQFSGSIMPIIVKAEIDLHFEGLREQGFDRQITKELILEDALLFLLPAHNGLGHPKSPLDMKTEQRYGGCEGTYGLCLTEDQTLLLIQFLCQLRTPGPFELLYPTASPERSSTQDILSQAFTTTKESGSRLRLSVLLDKVCFYYSKQGYRSDDAETQTEQDKNQHFPGNREHCVDPHLKQLYTDPPLILSPPFNPSVKEYHAEVAFDVVTLRLRPEPINSACHIHLDEHRGPREANYPVGLGNSKINILVTDESDNTEPVVMTIYILHMYRESRPSLPMFGDHVMCGFVQDCGLVVQPDQPCGLEPYFGPQSIGNTQAPTQPCMSGDVLGRWVVPCLSCADNRTCDWREVAWQPDGCYHPFLDLPLLQECMRDKKVMFIGDSTNRGMMYFLMERVNSSLEDWGKAHDSLVYHNVNQGHTHVSYSYYPQFWLEKNHRPTFQRALEQLIQSSRPLENSHRTVLVAGGVQWLSANHLRILKEVLEREELQNIMVVVKSLGMGFHLPVDGIHSLSPRGVQELYKENKNIITTAKQYGYEVIDTLILTMGRYKEFLQGRCACHFHEVEKLSFSKAPLHRKMKILQHFQEPGTETSGIKTGFSDQPTLQDQDKWAGSNSSTYHVRGAVNQVYSHILLSRLCMSDIKN